MKLTGELKDKVDKTESMEEKKDIIAEAGMELTDDELESVTGGVSLPGGISLSDGVSLSDDFDKMKKDFDKMNDLLKRI